MEVRRLFDGLGVGDAEGQAARRFSAEAVEAFPARNRHAGEGQIPDDDGPPEGVRDGVRAQSLDPPDELMAENQRERHGPELALGDVDVGSADAAVAKRQPDMAGTGLGDGVFADVERARGGSEDGGLGGVHGFLLPFCRGSAIMKYRFLH